MGKKKKNEEIILNNEELQSTTLGYLEDEKKGPAGLIILFLIFILFAFFLPTITKGVNKLFGKDTTGIVQPNVDQNKEKENNDTQEIKMYDLSDELAFQYNNINFSEFKKYQDNKKYYISFKLENNSKNLIDLSKTKYYIETYSEDKTLLERHVFNYTKINTKSYSKQIIELNSEEYEKINKLVISLKTIEDYPDVTLKINTSEEYVLTCNNVNNILIYTFNKNSKLVRINDTVNYNNDNSIEYANSLNYYRNQVATINNKDGISSSLVEITTGFTVKTDVNVKNADLSTISNDKYYGTENVPKEIKFEMESRGYNCQ